MDDSGRAKLQVTAAGEVSIPGVRKGYDKRVTGDASPNLERRGERGVVTGGEKGRRGRQYKNLRYGVSCKGRT